MQFRQTKRNIGDTWVPGTVMEESEPNDVIGDLTKGMKTRKE